MLIKCPECDLQVSDKAISCPHCGYPLDKRAIDRVVKSSSSTKKKKLPNGFGRITKLNNKKLRKPYRAMVTVGKDEFGKPIGKILKPDGYFETYNDAYAALIDYYRNPYDLDDCITVEELYERWSAEYFKTLKNESSIRTIKAAWNYCSSVYKLRATDVRARHIKYCMDEGIYISKGEKKTPTPNIKSRIKSMFNLMFDYALEFEIVDRNYARTFELSGEIIKDIESNRKKHIPFTDAEMQILWDNVETRRYVDLILIQCYTGWRPQELGLLEMSRVDLKDWSFVGGIKTDAGFNRYVPIHPRIRHLVLKYYKQAQELGSEYLINCTDTTTHRSSTKMTYDKYSNRFKSIVNDLKLNPEHRSHDPRSHFSTMAKKYGVDEYALKYILGHKIGDITERVYTTREKEWLQSEMQKIK